MTVGIGQKTLANSGGGASVTTGAVTTVNGSCIVLFASYRRNRTVSTIGDNKGNTYTLIRAIDDGFGITSWYRCENAVGGAGHTANVTLDGASELSLGFLELTGNQVSLDKEAGQLDASGPPYTSGLTATTTEANELLIGIAAGGNINPIDPVVAGATPSSGWVGQNECSQLDGGSWWSYKVFSVAVSATGSYEFGNDNALYSANKIGTFKEARPAVPLMGGREYVMP